MTFEPNMSVQSPAAHREAVEEVLDAMTVVAETNGDLMLAMAAAALHRVYALYPQAHELRHRGTPEHLAHLAIHNAITEAVNTTLARHGAAPSTAAEVPGRGSVDV